MLWICSAGSVAGLNDLTGLFQLWLFYDSLMESVSPFFSVLPGEVCALAAGSDSWVVAEFIEAVRQL